MKKILLKEIRRFLVDIDMAVPVYSGDELVSIKF